MGFGILGLVAKLQKWDESALFFDGSSLGRCQILTRPTHTAESFMLLN